MGGLLPGKYVDGVPAGLGTGYTLTSGNGQLMTVTLQLKQKQMEALKDWRPKCRLGS